VPLKGSARAQFRIEMLTRPTARSSSAPPPAGVATFGTITTQAGFSRTTQFLFRLDF
jgi:hypothetical protein